MSWWEENMQKVPTKEELLSWWLARKIEISCEPTPEAINSWITDFNEMISKDDAISKSYYDKIFDGLASPTWSGYEGFKNRFKKPESIPH